MHGNSAGVLTARQRHFDPGGVQAGLRDLEGRGTASRHAKKLSNRAQRAGDDDRRECDPRIGAAVRLESPVQTFFRTTTDEALIENVRIPAGEKVLMFLGSANRDPRRWAEADRFDITRNTTGHVGFGAGIHACVGQLIARLEGEIILTLLATRVRSLQLTAPPTAHLNNTLRGWSSIPISVQAS